MFFISESWYISGTVNGCVSHHKALSRRQFVGWLCDWIEKRGPSSWRFIYLLNDLMGEQYIKVFFVTFKDTKETGWSRSGKQEILPEVITASVSSNVISTSPQLMVVLENPYYQIFTETLQKKNIYICTYFRSTPPPNNASRRHKWRFRESDSQPDEVLPPGGVPEAEMERSQAAMEDSDLSILQDCTCTPIYVYRCVYLHILLFIYIHTPVDMHVYIYIIYK